MSDSLTDDNLCPLCQGNNQCGVDSETPCWCTQAKVPAQLIEQVPENLQGKSCICQQCIEQFNLTLAKEVQ